MERAKLDADRISIEVDRDVFAYLQKYALPFVDTPNSTLRRLLQIDGSSQSAPLEHESLARENGADTQALEHVQQNQQIRTKAPKADLEVLVECRSIQPGEELYLIDYKGNRLQNFIARVSGNHLIYGDQRYSMSDLAQKLLRQVGFRSQFVRGPAHWTTGKGKSIRDLWQEHLKAAQ